MRLYQNGSPLDPAYELIVMLFLRPGEEVTVEKRHKLTKLIQEFNRPVEVKTLRAKFARGQSSMVK